MKYARFFEGIKNLRIVFFLSILVRGLTIRGFFLELTAARHHSKNYGKY